MINTGLGRFGLKQKQPMPFDHDRLIIFVVGGVSLAEMREMSSIVSSAGDNSFTFYCGGSCLLSPGDILPLIL